MTQHLVGYETLRTPFTKRTGFPVTNQFGTITIDLTRRDLLQSWKFSLSLVHRL